MLTRVVGAGEGVGCSFIKLFLSWKGNQSASVCGRASRRDSQNGNHRARPGVGYVSPCRCCSTTTPKEATIGRGQVRRGTRKATSPFRKAKSDVIGAQQHWDASGRWIMDWGRARELDIKKRHNSLAILFGHSSARQLPDQKPSRQFNSYN